ncbi:hypothetical protein GCM10011579_007300 [Streptomyces albiflavescens]|uniref:Uncharacterized protein n=1 Tax=Streptomyces albiflavescens TaxID=1623582 RepID=A0A918CZ26_9ACTN|nr:hypothetical protein GCM10011579_007300 [Streptomyces albiflavescens]
MEAEAGGDFGGTLVGRQGHHQDRLVGQLVGGGAQQSLGGLACQSRAPTAVPVGFLVGAVSLPQPEPIRGDLRGRQRG